jgi:S-formylglutathione hydrolase FrmB
MRVTRLTSVVAVILVMVAGPPTSAQEEAATIASPSLSPSTAAPSPSPLTTIGLPADDGARVVGVEQIDDRTRDLTIESPAVGTVKVRLLLPAAFEAQAEARWPVLYLLQGCCDTYDSWTRDTDVEELTAATDLLVVMPAATRAGDDGFGWYTDWYNGGAGGPPAWETFHLTELRQLLERNWQAGDDRVIAGLSMGGYGAMTYAARHPDMFKAAASFSGVLHTLDPKLSADVRVWGSKTQQADIWAAHDPVSLAPALEGLPLYVAYGNGELGPLDQEEDPEAAGSEAWLLGLNEAFVARLEELAIPATVNAYGAGTHTWPYWERGLHEAMPMLLEALGEETSLPPASQTPAPVE